MCSIIEKKVVPTIIDKNNGWYNLGLIFLLDEPQYEVYIRNKRSWKNLWITWWVYRCTLKYDPRGYLTNLIKENSGDFR